MSAVPDAPPAVSADAGRLPAGPAPWRLLPSRVATLCLVELQKLRHDRSELLTRMIQPILWLVVFGQTFTRLRAIPLTSPRAQNVGTTSQTCAYQYGSTSSAAIAPSNPLPGRRTTHHAARNISLLPGLDHPHGRQSTSIWSGG